MDQPDPILPLLKIMAARYIWWKTPDQAVAMPQRVIAQVMNIGDFEDVRQLLAKAGPARFRDALARAEAGQFTERSWHYWHYRLGVAELGRVPALPQRRLSTA